MDRLTDTTLYRQAAHTARAIHIAALLVATIAETVANGLEAFAGNHLQHIQTSQRDTKLTKRK